MPGLLGKKIGMTSVFGADGKQGSSGWLYAQEREAHEQGRSRPL